VDGFISSRWWIAGNGSVVPVDSGVPVYLLYEMHLRRFVALPINKGNWCVVIIKVSHLSRCWSIVMEER